jgi:hypothetical protein
VVGDGGGGAAFFDLAAADVAGRTVVRRDLALAFAAAAAGLADVVVAGGDATADARAEALAIGDTLLAGVDFPPPLTIPTMISTMMPTTAMPTFCSFFIDGPSGGPLLSP